MLCATCVNFDHKFHSRKFLIFQSNLLFFLFVNECKMSFPLGCSFTSQSLLFPQTLLLSTKCAKGGNFIKFEREILTLNNYCKSMISEDFVHSHNNSETCKVVRKFMLKLVSPTRKLKVKRVSFPIICHFTFLLNTLNLPCFMTKLANPVLLNFPSFTNNFIVCFEC